MPIPNKKDNIFSDLCLWIITQKSLCNKYPLVFITLASEQQGIAQQIHGWTILSVSNTFQVLGTCLVYRINGILHPQHLWCTGNVFDPRNILFWYGDIVHNGDRPGISLPISIYRLRPILVCVERKPSASCTIGSGSNNFLRSKLSSWSWCWTEYGFLFLVRLFAELFVILYEWE